MRKSIRTGLAALATSSILLGGCEMQEQIRTKVDKEVEKPSELISPDYLIQDTGYWLHERGPAVNYSPTGNMATIDYPVKWSSSEEFINLIGPLLEPQDKYTLVSRNNTNQVFIQFPIKPIKEQETKGENLEKKTKSVIAIDENHSEIKYVLSLADSIDVKPPVFRTQVYIVRADASYIDEVGAELEAFLKSRDVQSSLDIGFINGLAEGSQFAIGGIIGRGLTEASFNLFLSNLSKNNYVTGIASTAITSDSGEIGNIENKLRIPIPKQTLVGTNIVTAFEYTDVLNKLEFTASPRGNREINLQLQIQQGDVVQAIEEIPRISQAQISSRVTLSSGQYLVLGGTLDARETGSVSSSSIIGDLLSKTEQGKSRSASLIFLRPVLIDTSHNGFETSQNPEGLEKIMRPNE